MSILSRPEFHDEQAAYDYVEARLWPNGPTCPRCGEHERVTKMQGKSTRMGTYKCRACRKPFTVKVSTIFESSHVPMHLWLQAIYLMCSSKKGISSNQLHRTLGVTLKTAWFMSHRIREAMRGGKLRPFGTGGGSVEVDETFFGNDRTIKPKGTKKGRGYHHKFKVLSLVDRETGQAESMVVDSLKSRDLVPILKENIAREANVLTDEAAYYQRLGEHFASHRFVHHGSGVYVSKADKAVHTNTIEGYFSVFKRGMKGVYQDCGKEHLHRHLAEFDFRYNHRIALEINNRERSDIALSRVVGKRLKYRDSSVKGVSHPTF
ncbi:MAG: IS1595 family transposase [Gammaproteobacteria bacterium]|nr:IS1595 family transposase [Gammaproteobacteria bacterium]|tara:strand:+ start:1987 stop:2946 length:960 start_codon:yes stop_codon:yes gene_type:complete